MKISIDPVIVLTNPKTVINLKQVSKVIEDQIIRSDQLIVHIKRLLSESKDLSSSEKEMYEMADFFLSLHIENTVDYTKKYFQKVSAEPKEYPVPVVIASEETPLYQELERLSQRD